MESSGYEYHVGSSQNDKPRRDGTPRKKVYYSVVHFRGRWDCNCPRGMRGEECKHIQERKRLWTMAENNNALMVREQQSLAVPEGFEPLDLRIPTTLPSSAEFDMMKRIASTAFNAQGMVPANVKTPHAALGVMLAGFELGMPPMTALRRVFIVNGKTELETQAMMGLVRANDPTAEFRWIKYEEDECIVELWRRGKLAVRANYTKKMAENAGQLTKGGPWKSYTRDMMAYAAAKRACRLGAPDCINMIGTLGAHIPAERYNWTANPDERARGDEDGAPINQVAAALVEGKVEPEDVFGSDDFGSGAQPEGPDDPEMQPAPAVDEPASPEVVDRLNKMLIELTTRSDFVSIWNNLTKTYWPGKRPKNMEEAQLTSIQATSLMNTLRGYLPEPPPEPPPDVSPPEGADIPEDSE